MTTKKVRLGVLAAVPAFVLAILAGCGPRVAAPKAEPSKTGTKPVAQKAAHDPSGWWCGEHGVPEEECSMCSAKVAKEFKAKGDWCDKHDRAKSQCFLCDPSLKDKFAAQYRAKEGKEPPEPDGQKDEKK